MWDLQHTPSRWDCQLVRGTIYYGWSDSGPIAGGTIGPTQTLARIGSKLLWYHIMKWTLSLTQPHKTNLMGWGLHPLVYYERL